ncbi:MAG TPA: butyrate kinase, partial [Candidatus Marinimicrobia bacterium]|nr:butyrate kinase [Candidatus Neomarinimicrobiota bacterium]
MKKILTINPGSTSTKIGLFRNRELIWEKSIPFPPDAIHSDNVAREFEMRYKQLMEVLNPQDLENLSAAVGRGGPLKPMEGGVYAINEKMLDDLRHARYGNHASNLGAMLADAIAKTRNLPAFIIDPVTVDEFEPISYISGVPAIRRKSRSHALNIKAMVRRCCDEQKWTITETNFVVAHLGGGISIAAVKKGRIADVNDGLLGMGPFSPERAGALPLAGLIELAFSGEYSKAELEQLFSKNSGLKAYLGTNDARKIEQRIANGDEKAKLIYDAMIYQIRKEIGAMLAACDFSPKAILLTGGLTHSEYIQSALKKHIPNFKIFFYPGENELIAMADGAFRVLSGQTELK